MNASNNLRLNNPDFLIDLSSYAEELSTEHYFTNIIDSYKTDDCLYQFPISFTVCGLIGPKGLSNNLGFTFEEYVQVTDGANITKCGRNGAADADVAHDDVPILHNGTPPPRFVISIIFTNQTYSFSIFPFSSKLYVFPSSTIYVLRSILPSLPT